MSVMSNSPRDSEVLHLLYGQIANEIESGCGRRKGSRLLIVA